MTYTCCEDNRRAAVDAHPTLNGVDWLEVLDLDAPAGSPRQRTLLVRLLKPVPAGLTPDNVRIDGGERIRRVSIEWVGIASTPPADATAAEQTFFTALPDADQVLLVRTDTAGDHSSYRMHLAQGSGTDAPLPDFDPRLSAIYFAFKVDCPSDFDCAPRHDCPDEPTPAPDIDYLARDYASLRRLVVDRLTRHMPGWRDRSPADLATTLAELIAYVGDLQHYHLDAITTEGYLFTARLRRSLRRHALLVDYAMHDGCNARAWLHLEVSAAAVPLPAGLRFYTRVPGVPPRVLPDSPDERTALQTAPLVFEPMHDATLHIEHNDFVFYTWGDARCCLAVGATEATLLGHWPDLATGDVLIVQEMKGPLTNEAEDADPAHRHAVRLTAVRAFDGTDPLTDPLNGAHITDIRWHADDALPFPLCLSSETDEAHGSALIDNVSIALGNNILVDHGRSVADAPLGSVPEPRLRYPPTAGDPCQRTAPEPLPPRFSPPVADGPVTHQGTVATTRIEHGMRRTERQPFDPDGSARAAFEWRTTDAIPAITLDSTRGTSTEHWTARRDLLASRAADTHFVLDTEDDGRSRSRFGNDQHGRRPDVGTAFSATYRIGNGPEGNVGANTIAHAITTDGRIDGVTNPLPARGGQAQETAAEVRRHAPHAFRTQERAVTPADYADVTERLPGVQRAAAGLRWTGSWHTVFVTVDRDGGEPVNDAFATTAVEHLDRFRMAGHDLRINEPIHVSLEIDVLVCVEPAYFRGNVRLGLLDVLGNRVRTDGTRGLFHPDNFSFGQTVFLSPLYAAVRTVPCADHPLPPSGSGRPHTARRWLHAPRPAGDPAAGQRSKLSRARRAAARVARRHVMSADRPHAPDCRCCTGIDAVTPRRVDNPPGRSSIAYRIGRHGDFLESMQARLSGADTPALAALTTREASDFTLALTDALATSLDVLSFYTERVAHEHYLRTATERRSVREMARLIGYQLAPGVAAATHLAFTPAQHAGHTGRPHHDPGRHPRAERTRPGRAGAELRDDRPRARARRVERDSGADPHALAASRGRHRSVARRRGHPVAAGRRDPDRRRRAHERTRQ